MVSRSEKRLSAKAVAAFRDAGRYADGGGLYLIVGENQRKRWVLRIQVDGRRRDFGLGSLGKVSLADAREGPSLRASPRCSITGNLQCQGS